MSIYSAGTDSEDKAYGKEKKNVLQKLWGGVVRRGEILFQMRNRDSTAFRQDGNKGKCHCGSGKDHAGFQTGGQRTEAEAGEGIWRKDGAEA